jgi:phage shock protein C
VNRSDHRGDWTVVAAIALIALGVWFLLGNVFGEWWQEAVRQAFRVAWPLSLIALGVLLYLSASRGRLGASGRRLYRSRGDRMVSGVLAGVADYLGTDPTVVRVLYAIFGVLTGVWPAIVVYVIATIVVPEEPATPVPVEPAAWPQSGAPSAQQPVTPPPAHGGWPHTGTETVQTPSEPPAPPAPPAQPPAEQPPEQS